MEESIKQFELLCLSYEGLLEKERFALKEENFSFLEKIAHKKKSILDEIESVRLGMNFSSERLSWVKEQFMCFSKLQIENEQVMEDRLSALRQEISNISVQQKKQSSVRKSYVRDIDSRQGSTEFKA